MSRGLSHTGDLRLMTVIQKPTVSLFVLLSILSVAVLVTEAAQRHRWWSDGNLKTLLQLTNDQAKTLETIYQTSRQKLHPLMQALNREEKALSLLINEATTQEPDVVKQIDKVEIARGALSKERLLMIYRMRQELSSDQRDQLETEMRSRREELPERIRPQERSLPPRLPFPSDRRGDQQRR